MSIDGMSEKEKEIVEKVQSNELSVEEALEKIANLNELKAGGSDPLRAYLETAEAKKSHDIVEVPMGPNAPKYPKGKKDLL